MKEFVDKWGCGYVNGEELLGYYTMVQTSFLLFLSVKANLMTSSPLIDHLGDCWTDGMYGLDHHRRRVS